MISLEHTSRFYGTVMGVNDLHLELSSGSHGLVGPNGSGKTTLINLLTGNLAPSLGQVRVFGHNPRTHRKVLRKIGLCPASDVLYPNVSAYQWVRYLLSLHGFSQRDADQRAVTSLTRVGMESAMHSPLGTYSLGMRQRAKLAQSIAHEPDLLILDEPFNGLDPIVRHDMSDMLRQWTKDGRSLILASHILHEVEAVTDSFLLIHGGRVLASGEANDVQEMLTDFPQEVTITSTDLAAVARRLVGQSTIDGIRFTKDQSALIVAVRESAEFYSQMTEWVSQGEFPVSSLRSTDGNLTAAFESLLQVHRGEVE